MICIAKFAIDWLFGSQSVHHFYISDLYSTFEFRSDSPSMHERESMFGKCYCKMAFACFSLCVCVRKDMWEHTQTHTVYVCVWVREHLQECLTNGSDLCFHVCFCVSERECSRLFLSMCFCLAEKGICICLCVCERVCLCTHLFVFLQVCMCMLVCVSASLHVCVCKWQSAHSRPSSSSAEVHPRRYPNRYLPLTPYRHPPALHPVPLGWKSTSLKLFAFVSAQIWIYFQHAQAGIPTFSFFCSLCMSQAQLLVLVACRTCFTILTCLWLSVVRCTVVTLSLQL